MSSPNFDALLERLCVCVCVCVCVCAGFGVGVDYSRVDGRLIICSVVDAGFQHTTVVAVVRRGCVVVDS